MSEAATEHIRPPRAWLPHESPTTRIAWTVVVLYLAVLWKYMLIAATVVPFPTVHAPPEVASMVWATLPRALWPEWHPGPAAADYRQILPYVVLVLWPLCLVPWRRRGVRVLVAVGLLAIVAGSLWRASFLFLSPLGWFFGGLFLANPFVPSDGEAYSDYSLIGGTSCWVWLMIVVIGGNFVRRGVARGACSACGYSMAGLAGAVCPECGAEPAGVDGVSRTSRC